MIHSGLENNNYRDLRSIEKKTVFKKSISISKNLELNKFLLLQVKIIASKFNDVLQLNLSSSNDIHETKASLMIINKR